MQQIDIKSLDLNLLRIFLALYEEGTVTRAGDKLGLAQSSMSHALGRLREALGDQLFVRGTSGMIPTPYTLSIVEKIGVALESLQTTLAQGRDFDSMLSDRTFTLITTDVVEMILLPRLMAHLALAAPGISLVIQQMPRSRYREHLETGQADLAVGQLPPGHTDFLQQSLLTQSFACFARKGHPLEAKLDFDSFMAARQLVISPPAMAELHVKKALGSRAAQRHIALNVPHYMIAPFVLASTDLIAVMPTALNNYFLSLGTLTRIPVPFEIEPIVTRQFWHERSNDDLGCQWLRRTIAGLFADWSMADRSASTKPEL